MTITPSVLILASRILRSFDFTSSGRLEDLMSNLKWMAVETLLTFWGHVSGVLALTVLLTLATINASPVRSITPSGVFVALIYFVAMALYLRGLRSKKSNFSVKDTGKGSSPPDLSSPVSQATSHPPANRISDPPEFLPKWLFYFYRILVPVNLVLSANFNIDTGLNVPAIAAVGAFCCAIAVRKNEVGLLILFHATAVLVTVALLVLIKVDSTSVRGIAPASVMVALAYSVLMTFYLSGFTPGKPSKSPSLTPSTLQPPQAGAVDGTSANDASNALKAEEAANDAYLRELELFEAGDLDQLLWAKHIVETEGDSEKAKWRYIKERVATAPSRKAEQEKIRAEKEAALAEQERIRAEKEAARVAEQEGRGASARQPSIYRAYCCCNSIGSFRCLLGLLRGD